MLLLFAKTSGGGGPSLITLPDVSGMAFGDAQTLLADLGLVLVDSLSAYDDLPVGYVVSQSPIAGTQVSIGSAVELTLSLGADPRNFGEVALIRFSHANSTMRFTFE